MKLFKKPQWLKPELNETTYWVHVLLIAVTFYTIMNVVFSFNFVPSDMFFIVIAFTIGDIIAHTLLEFD